MLTLPPSTAGPIQGQSSVLGSTGPGSGAQAADASTTLASSADGVPKWVPGLTCSHSYVEALPLLSQPLRFWDDHIVQRHCTSGLCIPAHLTLWLANLKARGVLQQPGFLNGRSCQGDGVSGPTGPAVPHNKPEAGSHVLRQQRRLVSRLLAIWPPQPGTGPQTSRLQSACNARTLGTRKAVMPLGPGCPVRAMTRYRCAAPAPEMKALPPFST